MGQDFKCGCRVSGSWYLCEKHELVLINLITEAELNSENTISDVVRDKKGNVIKFINKRSMPKLLGFFF